MSATLKGGEIRIQWPALRLQAANFSLDPTLDTLPIIFIIVLLGWFWLDSARTREIALGICRAACERSGVQFLDQTVFLRRLGVRWPPQGLRFRRVYRFDYSEEGVGRRTGYLVMLGVDLEEISLGLPARERDA